MAALPLADAVPAPFTAGALLRGWELDPLVVIPIIVIGALYLLGYRRVRRQPRPVFSPWRAGAFVASLLLVVAAVDGPMDVYSDVDVAVHMAQHVILIYAVAPLAVLGAPATVALRALSPARRARYVLPVLHNWFTHALTRPFTVGLLFACALLGTHFTAWYNLSLENQYIHDLEHLSYIVFGFLVWEIVIGVDPIRGRATHPQRILLVFLLMPVMVIISVVFILANHPLYPYYAALPAPWGGFSRVVADQGLAGAIMWVPSLAVTLAAVLYVSVAWFREDEARQRRLEELEDARERLGA
ncbi:MAG: cytochrome c oxidase assembly protein [Solirubrobacteraceae bacterium]